MTLDEFIEKTSSRPLPQNSLAQIRTLAKELAEGALEGVWQYGDEILFNLNHKPPTIGQDDIQRYLDKRWKNNNPSTNLLVSNGYITETGLNYKKLAPASFELLEVVEPTNIFISYKRTESSAFALMVLLRLKAAGLEPFLDLDLIPGEDWHAGLRERIQKYEYLIVLLGQESLKSKYIVKEIAWALEANLKIIPICHNGFKYNADEWAGLQTNVRDCLKRTHYIPVEVESAAGYFQALTLLLNRFEITP